MRSTLHVCCVAGVFQSEAHYSESWLSSERPAPTPAFLSIGGKRQYLWRAVDQDGDVIDILVQSRRNKGAARRFFKKLFKGQASTPLRVVTDKLRSYQAAIRELTSSMTHITDQYENNRAEVSHQPSRQQER